jgi:hypothetical protein
VKAKTLWSLWQALLAPFAACFTRLGWRRFVEWVTGLALNDEEHTITQSLIGLSRPGDWKALESFAEYGAWDAAAVETALARSLDDAPGRTWYRDLRVLAGDDTKVHRNSRHVWGTCTFHEYSARCPNRAGTVRAHNWVVVGALLRRDEQPARFLPLAGRLYFRQAQLPAAGGGAAVTFRTKNELLVEMVRAQAAAVPQTCLALFDGAYAVANVVRPLVRPDAGQRRVHFLTRLRQDARLYEIPLWPWDRLRGGQLPRWGRRLPPPRQAGRWGGPWQEGTAYAYGRRRAVRWKEELCLWRVSGHDVVVKVVVAEVEGYRKRFALVTSATALSGPQVVELFCARFRQEDGFRDLKQRLGWAECRAWTRRPIERTTQALFVTLGLLRRLEWSLQARGQEDWWLRPPWNRRKSRPSVLDVQRLLRGRRAELQQLLAAWLGGEGQDREVKEEVAAM